MVGFFVNNIDYLEFELVDNAVEFELVDNAEKVLVLSNGLRTCTDPPICRYEHTCAKKT